MRAISIPIWPVTPLHGGDVLHSVSTLARHSTLVHSPPSTLFRRFSMTRFFIWARSALVLGAVCVGGLALAQQNSAKPPTPPAANGQQAGGQEPPRQGPPAEALAACKTLASGAACSFTSPRGAEKGSCFAPEGRPLACRPARGPKGEGGQGPAGGPSRPKPAQ